MRSRYAYRPLHRFRSEIRLIRLLPRDDNKKLSLIPTCHVFHAALNDNPKFLALSYVWGDPNGSRVILVDNSPVRVTPNLYDAMMALRPPREPVIMWIDSICINQSDDEEKGMQVSLMAKIFQRAYNVVAWLGPADGSSDSVIDYLNSLGERAEACDIDNGPLMVFPQYVLYTLLYSMSGCHNQDGLLRVDGMRRFFTRPWWGRIWILQEITLPENAVFVCGTRTITRHRCSAVINSYTKLWCALMMKFANDQNSLTSCQHKMILSLFHHRPNVMLSSWNIYRYSRFPLAALLRATCVGSINHRRHGPHHLESTDPRDKIFALLGLAADRKELKDLGLLPDYTKSCKETYTIAMAALLQQGHISLLSCCQASNFQPNLPSWVPDWSRSITDMLQDVENDHITLYPRFSASGVESPQSSVTIIKRGREIEGISVKCYIYDRIHEVGSFPGRSSSHEVPLLETYSWPIQWLIEILRLTYHNQQSYETLTDRLRAVARSSIGGVGWNQNGQLAKVEDDRFVDTIVLLQKGFEFITEGHIKLVIRRLLADKSIKRMIEKNIALHTKLDKEIIGKSLGRLPFITERGNLVLSSEYVKRGDSVALIRGAQVPFILRHEIGRRYKLINEAYVDGIMNGEAMENFKCSTIDLV